MSEVSARTVLWFVVFFGMAVNYMIRINIYITIVQMVKLSKAMELELNEKEVYSRLEHKSIETIILDALNIKYDKYGFSWNEYKQELVLGAFYWLHWSTQIPGGILAKKYGGKLIFGLGNVISCWICFIVPIVAYINYNGLVFLLVLQGLLCGITWPAMHHMASVWIPPNERSTFVTAYFGNSIGVAVFYPVFGYVMSISSWEWVFHLCAITGTLWYILWLYFVYDTPASHPRINPIELEYIEQSLGNTVSTKSHDAKIPWRYILTSTAVWTNVIAQMGNAWGLFTLMTQAPIYFRYIHHWDIKMTGVLSGIPHLARMLFACLSSTIGDYLLRNNKMSTTNVRKSAALVASILNGLIVIALAYSGESLILAALFLTLATMVSGATSTGPLASVVDLSPNFAGVVLGISGVLTALPGFISPIIVGILTLGNQTAESWKYVFFITAGVLIGTGIIYILFGDSTLQYWNNLKTNNNVDN